MLQGLFVQRVSSFQKYCTYYVMKWVCELRMHIYMLEKTLIDRNEEIYYREVAFCKGMLPIEKESHFA